MTPVLCCGFECGVDTNSIHFTAIGTSSFSTSTVRNGARSGRVNPTATGTTYLRSIVTSAQERVYRFYIRLATLPSANCMLFSVSGSSNNFGMAFNSSDSKLYPAYNVVTTITFGSTGVSVTTGVWYRIDIKIIGTADPITIDLSVNGITTTQLTKSEAAQFLSNSNFGNNSSTAQTFDAFYDDVIISNTGADYPIGNGYINHFIPTADGTHNVAGANDFERSATGTDITNATTTAFQLIDDVPLKTGVIAEYINLIAPPNATDYVEVVFGPASGISTPAAPPRAIEVICVYGSASAGTNNLRLALNDNGSLNDVLNTTTGPGTTATYITKNYTDPPSAASAWTLSGNGNFNNIRMRCFTNDAAPDPWWASAMIEAEFAESPQRIIQISQSVNRSNTY